MNRHPGISIIITLISCLLLLSQTGAKWQKPLEPLTPVRSPDLYPEVAAPVIDNGKVYVASVREWMLILEANTGKKIAKFKLPAQAVESPAVKGEHIYMGFKDGTFRCLNASSGQTIWSNRFNSLIFSKPTIDREDVFVLTGGDLVVDMDAETGTIRWQYNHYRKEDLAVLGLAPALVMENKIFVGLSNGYVAALDRQTGRELWKSQVFKEGRFGDVDAPLAVYQDMIFATSFNGHTAALSQKSGAVLWRFPQGGLAGPLVVGDMVILTDEAGTMRGLNASSGAKMWETKIIKDPSPKYNKQLTTPASAENEVVVANHNGKIFVVSPTDGKIVKTLHANKPAQSAVQVAGNKAYLYTDQGFLYAFDL